MKKKDSMPSYMKALVEPVGEDGLNNHDREKLARLVMRSDDHVEAVLRTHRQPTDLKAAYTAYRAKLAGLSEGDFFKEVKDMVWLSAYAHNNPRSDYHWQCDLCYDESVRRGGEDSLYDKAHKAVMREAGYT